MKFSDSVVNILKKETLGYVSTSDKNGKPNVSLKGIIDYDVEAGIIFFLDLYCMTTKNNLTENPQIAIGVVDHADFDGVQLKGRAELITEGPDFDKHCLNWHQDKHKRYMERTSESFRIMEKKKHKEITEYDMPNPRYLVKVIVEEVITLLPSKPK